MRYISIANQNLVIMCIVRNIRNFVRNGVRVFSAASRGEYRNMSPEVRQLCRELAESSDGPAIDRRNLRQDKGRIYHDVSTAFNSCKSNIQ